MREKVLRQHGKVIFDARDLFDGRKRKGKVLIKMESGPASYESYGVRFFKEHPFQLVEKEDVQFFLDHTGFATFREAKVAELEIYYTDN